MSGGLPIVRGVDSRKRLLGLRDDCKTRKRKRKRKRKKGAGGGDEARGGRERGGGEGRGRGRWREEERKITRRQEKEASLTFSRIFFICEADLILLYFLDTSP